MGYLCFEGVFELLGKLETGKKKWIVVMIVCAIIFALTLFFALKWWLGGPTDTSEYKQETSSLSAVSEIEYVDNPIDFAALQAENPDVCGWITLPETKIDYPILQSSVEDDNFYLDHDLNKKKSVYGAIYIQRLNSNRFTDPNTVIYGHNMKNGTMFQNLHKFRNKDFFDANEYFYIYTPGHIYTYRIFAAYRSDNRHILNSNDFTDKQSYAEYIESVKNPQSLMKNTREVDITTDDRIVTLSTCISDERYRYLVQGVLIKDELTK